MRYRILLKDKVDAEILREIQEKYSKDIEGISKFYDLLAKDGCCDSNKVSRIYYVAYTLALKNIEIIIVKLNVCKSIIMEEINFVYRNRASCFT